MFESAPNGCRKSGELKCSKHLISCRFQVLLNNRFHGFRFILTHTAMHAHPVRRRMGAGFLRPPTRKSSFEFRNNLWFSCMFIVCSTVSRTHPEMFEQWSETRFVFVSISDHINPASTEHSPLCRRKMWRVCSFSFSLSMTWSRGCVFLAAVKSPFANA